MSILPAGTFHVSNYRKPMPVRVKLAAMAQTLRAWRIVFGPEPARWDVMAKEHEAAALLGKIRFDHRPPLQDRPYDTAARDFIPPQNDPAHIHAVFDEEHLARTFGATGRPERGDADRRKRVRSLSNKTEDERERRAAKAGGKHERRTDIPAPTKKSRKPKAKIARPVVYQWPKGRKIASRKNAWGRK